MQRLAAVAAGLFVCLTSALSAQTDSSRAKAPPTDSADVLVLDHTFTAGVGEFVRVFLQAKQVYRADLSTSDVSLEIRSPLARVQLPRIYPVSMTEGPSRGSEFEVYPEVDAEYEIRPVASRGGGVATGFRLYRDVRASRHRVAILNRPGWEIGMELATGWHSGFRQSGVALSGPVPPGGSDLEACFSARRAPGVPRLSMCVFGLGYQSQHEARSILWIYTEPRLRLFGQALPGQSNWELGTSFRFGAGSISASPDVPVILAPGLYVARHIRTDPSGSGWSLQLSYAHAWFKGFSKRSDAFEPLPEVAPHSDRVTFGFGWYQ
jgi:hypothetical protein